MAIIYTYPNVNDLADHDSFLVTDSSDENNTRNYSYGSLYQQLQKGWTDDFSKTLTKFRQQSDLLYQPIGSSSGASLFQYNASSFAPSVDSGTTPSVGAGGFTYALSVREGSTDIITFNFRINIVSLSDTSNVMRFKNIPGTPENFSNSAKWYGQVKVVGAPNIHQKATICEVTGSNPERMNFYRIDSIGDIVECNWTGNSPITESMYIQGSITYVSITGS